MIILKNQGLIEIDVITTMGVNVKECENPIGYFGTGLKYAIATLLRNNIQFYLMIGNAKFEFETELKTIRGQELDYCVMRGEFDSRELPFTTNLGKNWEVWQAYRELYSNCLDEGGKIYHDKSSYKSDGESTAFVITSEIDTGHCFLQEQEKKLLFSNDKIEIYKGESDYIYYRGIRAKDLAKPSIYTYNIKASCALTEDRMISYDWRLHEIISEAVASIESGDITKTIVEAKPTHFESRLDFDYFQSSPKPSDHFVKVCSESLKPNHSTTGLIRRHAPPVPKTAEEKRDDFIKAVSQLCTDYSVDCIVKGDSSETILILMGGVLKLYESQAA